MVTRHDLPNGGSTGGAGRPLRVARPAPMNRRTLAPSTPMGSPFGVALLLESARQADRRQIGQFGEHLSQAAGLRRAYGSRFAQPVEAAADQGRGEQSDDPSPIGDLLGNSGGGHPPYHLSCVALKRPYWYGHTRTLAQDRVRADQESLDAVQGAWL